MADGEYRRGIICRISRADFVSFSGSDVPFAEGIISVPDSDSIFVEETGKRFALALKTDLQYLTPKQDFILNACVCKETDMEIRQRDGNMKVFVLKNVLSIRGLHVGETVWVKKMNPVPLERVLIGISSEETYLWAKKSLATFLRHCLSTGPVTVRENDVFCLSNDQYHERLTDSQEEQLLQFSILQCEPVLQGCITSETSLVVSKLSEPETSLGSETHGAKSSIFLSDSSENFLVSDFARNPPGSLSQGRSGDLSNERSRSITLQLNVSSLDCDENIDAGFTYDASSRLHVSLATLIDLHMFNGSWVKICTNHADLACDNQQEKDYLETTSSQGSSDSRSISDRGYHIVQIVATASKNEHDNYTNSDDIFIPIVNSNKIEDGVGYIPSLLYFNLFHKSAMNDDSSPSIHIHPISDATQTEADSSTASQNNKPLFAIEAHVALVHSPHYKAGDSFDHALASHFKVPRVLTVGDVFYVHHHWQENSDARKEFSSSDDQGQRNVVVYFQVTRLVCENREAKSCFIGMEHSSLYQRGSVHSYVPAVQRTQFCDSRPSYWEQTSPAGLNSCTEALENVVKPYLNTREGHSLPPCGILLTGPSGAGKRTVAITTSKRLNLHLLEVNCFDLIGESVAATEARLKNTFQRAIFCSPCILLLGNIHALGKDKEGNDDEPRIAATMLTCIASLQEDSDWPVVVIATSSSPNDITSDMFSCFLHEVRLEAPTESERCDMLCGLATMASVGNDVSFEQLAKRTAGLVLSDFVALFSNASSAAAKRLLDGCPEKLKVTTETSGQIWFPWKLEQELSAMGVKICKQDFEDSLEILQSSLSDAIGAPKIPSVKWEDVGGLSEVKAEILDTVQLPLQHPELFAAGLRRSGVLLYGPPGTGKTLLAKAVATECSLNFLSVKGPELINMYVGQSEQNVREVFTRAQSARPCVIFFDELDSLAPNRGRSGDSGGVMDRVVSQLLAELDGLHKACDVFVIGATNRPDLLDPALLRPGRFDKLLYLGVSEDHGSQLNILKALTRKFSLHPDLQLENVAAVCPANLTGADFYALCSDAMLQSVKRKIELLEQGQTDPSEDGSEIEVTETDFQRALDQLVPSVSLHELKRYKDIQKQFTMANSVASKK
ncbi:peroxisomal assembly protein [Desmophyllum pertusum]|uniref:Peroxisomal ATPase PEX6 n=1 Tax=Desmophyllum pertusum TaxID=174260 RepID=A0A9W9YZ19_9CNID|nr:peroxisomal assembly protein [Desmophyllum pertusum]